MRILGVMGLAAIGLSLTSRAAEADTVACKVSEVLPEGANFFKPAGLPYHPPVVGDRITLDLALNELTSFLFESGNGIALGFEGAKLRRQAKQNEIDTVFLGYHRGQSGNQYVGSLVATRYPDSVEGEINEFDAQLSVTALGVGETHNLFLNCLPTK